ncbi:hypothetical protein LSAT2_016181 [Lamellibrachia satsuma]|nr:hypothetical protein LSAT2_016181 [Lamellibrachia satsuma]
MNLAAQLKQEAVELDFERSVTTKLKADIEQRDRLLSGNVADAVVDGRLQSVLLEGNTVESDHDVFAMTDHKVRKVEFEKGQLAFEVEFLRIKINALVDENTLLLVWKTQREQEIVELRAQVSQLTSDRLEAQNTLLVCSVERDTLTESLKKARADLAKQMATAADSIAKLQNHTEAVTSDLEHRYQGLHSEGSDSTPQTQAQTPHVDPQMENPGATHFQPGLAAELDSVKVLLDAREREAELLRDTINRQKRDVEALNHMVDVLKDENANNKRELLKAGRELNDRTREASSTGDSVRYLEQQKAGLQKEMSMKDQALNQARDELNRKAIESANLIKKLDETETKLRQIETLFHQKDTQVVAVETELHHVNKHLMLVEQERSEMKLELVRLQDDMKNAANQNTVMEQRLNMEKSLLMDEKSARNQAKDEVLQLSFKLEVLKKEYDTLVNNLDTERSLVHAAKEQRQRLEEKIQTLTEKIHSMEMDKQNLGTQLSEFKSVVEQLKTDKQTLYQDVQELCRKLSEKDDLIATIQESTSTKMETMQREFIMEKNMLIQTNKQLEENFRAAKSDTEKLNLRVRERDKQMESFNRIKVEFEAATRTKQELETRVVDQEKELVDARGTITSLRCEKNRLAQHHQKIQDALEKIRQTSGQLKDQLADQREKFTGEIHAMQANFVDEKHRWETDRNELQDQLSRAVTELKKTEVSLMAVTETRDSLAGSNQVYERTTDTLKCQLHEEVTTRKLAEQRIEATICEVEQLKTAKATVDDHISEAQKAIASLQVQLKSERDKFIKIRTDLQSTKNSSHSQEAHVHLLTIQINDLQNELTMVKNDRETTQKSLSAHNSRLALELEQVQEVMQKEVGRLQVELHQLTADLERSREQQSLQAHEVLRLQQELLVEHSHTSDLRTQLTHTQNSLSLEVGTREKLDQRIVELELLLSKLKARYKEEDLSGLEATRAEVNKMMSDLTRRIQDQMESQNNKKTPQIEALLKEVRKLEEYKTKVAALESALSQERSLHAITKAHLASIDEDNYRLRQQVMQSRKRLTIGHDHTSDRPKSRIEEINELIARSQSRANQLLSSGVYGDGPKFKVQSSDFYSTGGGYADAESSS